MDTVDKKIVTALQEDGRVSNVDLARLLEMAPSSVFERVKHLEEEGIITGYRAELNPTEFGFGLQALIAVNLSNHTERTVNRFTKNMQELPEVLWCVNVTGRFDYILHVVARDITHLRETIVSRVMTTEGVDKAETFIALAEAKKRTGLPIEISSETFQKKRKVKK